MKQKEALHPLLVLHLWNRELVEKTSRAIHGYLIETEIEKIWESQALMELRTN